MMTLALLDMIPKVGKISTTQIKERLDAQGYERDVRSIQRQMEVLAENFPIEKDDSSKPYGYKWKGNAKGISIPSLTLLVFAEVAFCQKLTTEFFNSELKLDLLAIPKAETAVVVVSGQIKICDPRVLKLGIYGRVEAVECQGAFVVIAVKATNQKQSIALLGQAQRDHTALFALAFSIAVVNFQPVFEVQGRTY